MDREGQFRRTVKQKKFFFADGNSFHGTFRTSHNSKLITMIRLFSNYRVDPSRLPLLFSRCIQMLPFLRWYRWMNSQPEVEVSKPHFFATISDECLQILEWARRHRRELVSKTFEKHSHLEQSCVNQNKVDPHFSVFELKDW